MIKDNYPNETASAYLRRCEFKHGEYMNRLRTLRATALARQFPGRSAFEEFLNTRNNNDKT
jgi:hypothetical protein